MNDKPKEPVSDFLAPSGWITAAQKAHPAFKFAVAVGGLAALVATITRFGASPATLVFGIVILVVLMVLFLVFAQAARLRRHKLSFASQFLVWAFLCLSIGTALLLFTSTFFNGPLPFRDYIIRGLGLPRQVIAPPGTRTTPVPAPDPKIAAAASETETRRAAIGTWTGSFDKRTTTPEGTPITERALITVQFFVDDTVDIKWASTGYIDRGSWLCQNGVIKTSGEKSDFIATISGNILTGRFSKYGKESFTLTRQ